MYQPLKDHFELDTLHDPKKIMFVSSYEADYSFIVFHCIADALKKSDNVCILSFGENPLTYKLIGERLGLSFRSKEKDNQIIFLNFINDLLSETVKLSTIAQEVNETCNNYPRFGNILFIVDHLSSLLTIGYNLNDILIFVYSLRAMTKQGSNISLIICGNDGAGLLNENKLISHCQHISDAVISVSCLPSGYCKDVHGQVSFLKL